MNYYSQHGEDYYIQEFFGKDYVGTCIDVGASEPIMGSNTYLFEQLGWDVYCIEPNPRYVSLLKDHRKKVYEYACGDEVKENVNFTVCTLLNNNYNEGAISSLKIDTKLLEEHDSYKPILRNINVNVITLDEFIKNENIEKIDFVSIDTEGTELDVLRGFDINKHSPKMMIIENNYNDPAIEEYLKDFGYAKKMRLAVNDFYVKE